VRRYYAFAYTTLSAVRCRVATFCPVLPHVPHPFIPHSFHGYVCVWVYLPRLPPCIPRSPATMVTLVSVYPGLSTCSAAPVLPPFYYGYRFGFSTCKTANLIRCYRLRCNFLDARFPVRFTFGIPGYYAAAPFWHCVLVRSPLLSIPCAVRGYHTHTVSTTCVLLPFHAFCLTPHHKLSPFWRSRPPPARFTAWFPPHHCAFFRV